MNRADVGSALDDRNTVFHLAAAPEVRTGENDPEIHFKQNLERTLS
jgi:nucleoside-diphosphate-sugar epimerase